MKRIQFLVVISVICLSVVDVGVAGSDKVGTQVRVELDLVDGSHVIGIPSIESITLQTSYAKMDLPLQQIMSIKIAHGTVETASVDLQNGDKLKGVVDLGRMKLQTVFGKVSIEITHIKELRVVLAGRGGLAGLVLYYSFDGDEGGKVTDGSGHGNHGYWVGTPKYAAGAKGLAVRFSSKDAYIVSSSEELNMNGWREATVSVWVSLEAYTSYGHIINRGALVNEQVGAFELGAGHLYGNGLVALRSGPTNAVGSYVSTKPNLSLKHWYLLTLTYDGTTVRYYIDGKLEHSMPACERDTSIWDGPATKLVIGNISRIPLINWTDMFFNGLVDEVHIFKRALREEEVRGMYDVHRK